MAKETGTAFASINESADTKILDATTGSGRLSVIVTNLETAAGPMWMLRGGDPAVADACIPLMPFVPFIATSDPDRTGNDNPLIKMEHRVIAAVGAGSGLKLSVAVTNQ